MIGKALHHIRRFIYYRKRNMMDAVEGGYASHGQDLYVAGLLNHKRAGTFVDIGANDGITQNNTLYFEKQLGWHGIAVEPVPEAVATLKRERSCHIINGCVSTQPGKAEFIESTGQNMFSTLGKYNTGLTARKLNKRAKQGKLTKKITLVDCFTLHQLLDKFNIKNIDFLSIDTEGGELDILKTIDFKASPVSVISAENNYFSDDIKHYLEKQDFVYMGTFSVDEIYAHISVVNS